MPKGGETISRIYTRDNRLIKNGLFLIISRIATAYYFIHFLVLMPILGFIEITKPLRKSISEPVLSKEEREVQAAGST